MQLASSITNGFVCAIHTTLRPRTYIRLPLFRPLPSDININFVSRLLPLSFFLNS